LRAERDRPHDFLLASIAARHRGKTKSRRRISCPPDFSASNAHKKAEATPSPAEETASPSPAESPAERTQLPSLSARRVIPGAGHFLPREKPDAVSTAILEVLSASK